MSVAPPATPPILGEQPLAPGIVQLTLRRVAQRNALDAALVEALHAAIARLGTQGECRVIVLAAEGPVFCAGADLREMRALAEGGDADANLADARRLAELLRAWHECAKPTLALVQGDALGGGLGLIAAADVAIAVRGARFRLPEVRLGLVPAVISPYVSGAIGTRAAARWMLTGEAFGATRARELGLVHELVAPGELASAGLALAGEMAHGEPGALADCKRLLRELGAQPPGEQRAAWTAALLAARRAEPATRARLRRALAPSGAGER